MDPAPTVPVSAIKYVDFAEYGFVCEPRYYFYGWSRSPRILGRKSVANALVDARSTLPRDFNFKIWDVKRSRRTQKLMRNSFRKRLWVMYPELSRASIERLVTRFGAKLLRRVTNLGTHILGGAVDLTIVDSSGSELYMGTDHDDLTPKAALDYFESRVPRSALDEIAYKNRRLLKSVMIRAGFHPYSQEWWHWSFKK